MASAVVSTSLDTKLDTKKTTPSAKMAATPSKVETKTETKTETGKEPEIKLPEETKKTSKKRKTEETPEGEHQDSESGSWMIVAKSIKMFLKQNNVHCGSDALPALNASLAQSLQSAVKRAQANGRKTIKGCDF